MTALRPRWETTRILADVAAGRRPADLVVRNGRWVNVHSGEILEGTDLAIVAGRFASCGMPIEDLIGPDTRVIDAAGRYLVPGLLDAHVHIESAMLTVSQYARAVVVHGTTGLFIDPHEIANVLGLAGVRLFLDEARDLAMHVYVQVPSCVPASPGLETSGAMLSAADVEQAMAWPGVIGLGEVMNFPGVAAGDEAVHAKIRAALEAGGKIGGHYASPDLGRPFHAYVAGGPSDCHEGRTEEDLRARVRQGMAAMVRQATGWRDLEKQLPALVAADEPLDPRHVLLCTDDRHAGTLVEEGHMEGIVRTAIAHGVPAITAIQMASLNTAEYFGVADEIGSIAPGRSADLFLTEDLEDLRIDLVIASGEVLAERGALTSAWPQLDYPPSARATVHLPTPLAAEAFAPPLPDGDGEHAVRAIQVREDDVVTEEVPATVCVAAGAVTIAEADDLAWLAVVERHHESGRIGHGLVRGFTLTEPCAVASTVAHDSHNLIVLGTSFERMADAANRVAELGGGLCVVDERGTATEIPLPIAGLLTERPATEVATLEEDLEEALRRCGCRLDGAVMVLSFLALPVIPALRLTDRGLVDVLAQRVVPLFVDADTS